MLKYHVCMLADTGGYVIYGGASPTCERRRHSLTWCTEYSLADALRTCMDIIDGRSRQIHSVWIEEEDPTGRRTQTYTLVMQ